MFYEMTEIDRLNMIIEAQRRALTSYQTWMSDHDIHPSLVCRKLAEEAERLYATRNDRKDFAVRK